MDTEPRKYDLLSVFIDFEMFEEEDDLSMDTFWTFTPTEYLSKDDFIHDVQQSEEQNGTEPDERLRPDRILCNNSHLSISISKEFIIGGEGIRIEIASDNGINITKGELLFKLHNHMIPYLDRLTEHTIGAILAIGYRRNIESGCIIQFDFALEAV